ncbi:adenylate/guanylate cyclase domain-containing protein [Robiginitalea sp. SC105]|uniref:adenylate/guanylate cyclase domain-containing protein n=1 Tax=Robiginitalea sp. SC105 TaxID=2762332 RepID=UPI0016395A77|nr:adenylate/guanylate cyclase domain-containing protein [Robiginitalea sp. SC105]MBC2839544.1 tetratricopeptide repeat protein [Robiginitalea sp. SC105]
MWLTNPDSSITLAIRALDLSNVIDYEIGKAKGFKSIGVVNYYRSNFSEALDYFNRSLLVYEKENDTLGISNIQSNIGSVYQTTGDDPNALKLFMESLRNAEIVNDSLRIGTAYVNIGTVYKNDDLTYDQAIENFDKSIRYFEGINYGRGLASAYVNIGELFLAQEDPESALPYLNDALERFREVGFDPATPLNLIGAAYLKMEDFANAEDFYRQALASSVEKETKLEEAKAYLGIGNVALQRQNPALAVSSFNSGLEIAQDAQLLREISDAYLGLSRAYALQNDYGNAYEMQQKHNEAEDSLRNSKYAEEMSQLRTVFDLERREQENELLNTQNKLYEVQIEEETRAKNLLLIILGLFLAIIAGFIFQYFYIKRTNRRLAIERNRSDEILLNILPEEAAAELKEKGHVRTKEFEEITVLFTDFRAFSVIAERVSAEMLVKSVDYYFKNFDAIMDKYGIEKIKTIGDAYMCAGGIPTPNTTNAEDAFNAAREIVAFTNETEWNPPKGIYPFEIRVGLNTGPVVAGVVGTKKFAYDIWGNTVNIASRMESSSEVGRINVSENTYQKLKDSHRFSYRGEIEVKNGMFLRMYFADLEQEAEPANV